MEHKFNVVVTRKYMLRGEEKKSYITIGKAFDGPKGLSLKIDTVPLGWDGWASLYPPKDKPAIPAGGGLADMSDDIPF